MAVRMVSSCSRRAMRARIRLATLAQAISSTKAAAPSRVHSSGLAPGQFFAQGEGRDAVAQRSVYDAG